MNPTHVFFDFAGTLVEGVPNWEWPQIAACAESGTTVSANRVKTAIWRVWGPLEGCAHEVESGDESLYQTWIDDVEGRILRDLGVSDRDLPRAIRRVTNLQIHSRSYRLYPDGLPALRK